MGVSGDNGQMRSWRLVGVWALVLVITTALTWQIVSLASDQVAETPVAIAPAATTTTGSSTASSPPSSTTARGPGPTSTTTAGASPTSSAPNHGSSSTSAPSASTSAVEWSLRTVTTQGGTVVVRYRQGEVELQAATPAPGFEMDIDDSGPPRVRVEFENDDQDFRVEARWQDGGLDVEVTGD